MGMSIRVVEGDCVTEMAKMEESSVGSVVTDPPYGLEFMGKEFDRLGRGPKQQEWHRLWAVEALRVLKPGGHLLAFGGTRTHHRLVCALEDAGFEIRDTIMWLYGSGFPKSLNVSKAIDKAAGHSWDRETERCVCGVDHAFPHTDDARRWAGRGTALKPAYEPIVVARRPLEGTVAANVLAHGTGAINIDDCRVATSDNLSGGAYAKNPTKRDDMWSTQRKGDENVMRRGGAGEYEQPSGRWPANVILDDEAAAILDGQSDGVSRFFYCAKASRSEWTCGGVVEGRHPTVKPIGLMRYLVRMVTPAAELVLDPFCGSGSTLIAAAKEGCRAVGIEQDSGYVEIAEERLRAERI